MGEGGRGDEEGERRGDRHLCTPTHPEQPPRIPHPTPQSTSPAQPRVEIKGNQARVGEKQHRRERGSGCDCAEGKGQGHTLLSRMRLLCACILTDARSFRLSSPTSPTRFRSHIARPCAAAAIVSGGCWDVLFWGMEVCCPHDSELCRAGDHAPHLRCSLSSSRARRASHTLPQPSSPLSPSSFPSPLLPPHLTHPPMRLTHHALLRALALF